jgi:hypothetical protein
MTALARFPAACGAFANPPRRPARRQRVAILAAAALTSVTLFATGPAAEPAQRQEKAWPVAVIAGGSGAAAAPPSRVRPGGVEPHGQNSHRPGGRQVHAVHVSEGDWVQATATCW